MSIICDNILLTTATIFEMRKLVVNKYIPDIYNFLQEIAWHFGSHGINGECCGDLSFVEFMSLKKVYENNDISIQEIGNAINFTKSGATRIVNRLEEKGYVSRKTSPIDGRICCVGITDKGIDVVSKILDRYMMYLEELIKEFNPQKQEQLRDTLEMLVNALQKNIDLNPVPENIEGCECK